MTIKEMLEELGFNTYKHADEKFNELKEQFMEMSQLKSDFDIEKFTVKKEGNFIAHNFHFLMRQYSLALGELKRMLIEKEGIERDLENLPKTKEKSLIEGEWRYPDLYARELINRLDRIELQIVNKAMMVRGFEACRLKLIELNGGKPPTNAEYQLEEPKYWKWFLQKKALFQASQGQTGISEGVWENIHYLEEKPLINPNYQIDMKNENGLLDFNDMLQNVESRKQLDVDKEKLIELEENVEL